jgi:cardiolipin synthase
MKTILESKKRGVEIKLLVPEHPNHFIVDIGARTYFNELLSNGIQVFLYKKMIHGKTIVVDDTWSTIGSLNLDNISLRYNFEANLVSTNTLFASELKTQFEKDLTDANLLTLEEWKKRPLTNKILEWLVWPLRKLL